MTNNELSATIIYYNKTMYTINKSFQQSKRFMSHI